MSLYYDWFSWTWIGLRQNYYSIHIYRMFLWWQKIYADQAIKNKWKRRNCERMNERVEIQKCTNRDFYLTSVFTVLLNEWFRKKKRKKNFLQSECYVSLLFRRLVLHLMFVLRLICRFTWAAATFVRANYRQW